MELSEAKEILKEWLEYNKEHKDEIKKADTIIAVQETILKALDNSISKDKVQKKIEEINSVNYEDVKTTENDYDEWFWKTTGAENALKELLGEE